MDDEPEMDRGLPVVLRQRHRWKSPATEKKIEGAWGPRGPVRSVKSVGKSAPHTVLYDCM